MEIFKKQRDTIRKSLAIEPNYIDAHNNLGIIYSRQGRLNEAIGQYLEAIRLGPGNVEAYNNMGVAYARQGRIKEAVRCFSKALEIKPDFQDAKDNLKLGLE